MSQDDTGASEPLPPIEQVWEGLREAFPAAGPVPNPEVARGMGEHAVSSAVHAELLRFLPFADHATWEQISAELENTGSFLVDSLNVVVPGFIPTRDQVRVAVANNLDDLGRAYPAWLLLALHAAAGEWHIANRLGVVADRDAVVYRVCFEQFMAAVLDRWQQVAMRTLLADFAQFDELFTARTGRAPAYRAPLPGARYDQLKREAVARDAALVEAEEGRAVAAQERAEFKSQLLRTGGLMTLSALLGAGSASADRRAARRAQGARISEDFDRKIEQRRSKELRDLNLKQARRREDAYKDRRWGG